MRHSILAVGLVTAFLASQPDANAQTYVWANGVVTPAQYSYDQELGANKIVLSGPPGAVVNGYCSETGTFPDSLTMYQMNASGLNDMNFSYAPVGLTMTTTLDANGNGELELYRTDGGGDGGVDILPVLFILLTCQAPGVPVIFMEEQLVQMATPVSQSIFQYAGGAEYRGPWDLVPPNLGCAIPSNPGTNQCGTPAAQSCLLFPEIDPLGCGPSLFEEPNPQVIEYDVHLFPYESITFDCVNDSPGYAGSVAYHQLKHVLDNTTATWIDFTTELVVPNGQPTPCFDTYFHVPVGGVREYCPEWLWMREPDCKTAQEIDQTLFYAKFIGTQTPITPDIGNVWEGFHFTPFGLINDWDLANGNGRACLFDNAPWDICCMTEMRIRYRVDCLRNVLNALNPPCNYGTVFTFGGAITGGP